MTDDRFDTNLMKMIAAEVFSLVSMQTSREMFGKGYFALGVGEKLAVDQAAYQMLQGNYRGLTPEFLKNLSGQVTQQQAGFQVPEAPTETPKKP